MRWLVKSTDLKPGHMLPDPIRGEGHVLTVYETGRLTIDGTIMVRDEDEDIFRIIIGADSEIYVELPKEPSMRNESAVQAILTGLTTDGAHHKQYYLEQTLRLLYGDEYTDQNKRNLNWEDGIPS